MVDDPFLFSEPKPVTLRQAQGDRYAFLISHQRRSIWILNLYQALPGRRTAGGNLLPSLQRRGNRGGYDTPLPCFYSVFEKPHPTCILPSVREGILKVQPIKKGPFPFAHATRKRSRGVVFPAIPLLSKATPIEPYSRFKLTYLRFKPTSHDDRL